MHNPVCEIIDVSEHNSRCGAIDWGKVKAGGVKGVMVRVGWAGYDGHIARNNGLDDYFDENIRGAAAAGLDVGLYVYSYCKTPAAARLAAEECVSIAKRYPGKITLPIAFDVEETKLNCLTIQGRDGLSETVNAFLFAVEQAGYYGVFYTYTAFALQFLNLGMLMHRDLWLADYRSEEKARGQIGRDFGMWQYIGDKGRCEGVTGACDRNYCYRDYPEIIREAGLNGFEKPDLPGAPDYKSLYEQAQQKLERIAALLEAGQEALNG